MCCVMLNLSGSFSTQIKMESEEWQIQAERKSKNMMNYSGRFAAADSKAENSLCVFLHDAIWESTNLLWRATVYAASRSKLISTTSVTASCLIFMVEENV